MTISGLLAVNGNLTVSGINNRIFSVRNYPAAVIAGKLIFKQGSSLLVNGLAQVNQNVEWALDANNVYFEVNGGLYVGQSFVDSPLTSTNNHIIINPAAPKSVVTQYWDPDKTPPAARWRPMRAVFKNVVRKF
jgi:hypothetical protein